MKENFVPKLRLSSKDVVFEGVSYGDNKTMQLEIENIGDGLLEFEINKIRSDANQDDGQQKRVSDSWLQIEPLRGVIKGGEKMQITCKLQITSKEAHQFFLHK